jgi:hypothetical protein
VKQLLLPAASRDEMFHASRIMMELQFLPDPACKLSTNLYDMYHCCVYSENLLMMDRGIV